MASESKSKILQFRVDQAWLHDLDGSLERLKYSDADPIDRSTFARELIGAENAFLRNSPYICSDARHFVLITRRGEALYHRGEVLRLNVDVEKIPGTLKVGGARGETRLHDSREKDLFEKNALGAYVLWNGTEPNGQPIDEWFHYQDFENEIIDLQCGKPDGSVVFREGCFFIQNFARYYDSKKRTAQYDRFGVFIDIPMIHFELTVVVDSGIYAKTSCYGGDSFKPSLSFEMLNREGCSLSGEEVLDPNGKGNMERFSASFPTLSAKDKLYSISIEHIEACSKKFEASLSKIYDRLGKILADVDEEDEEESIAKSVGISLLKARTLPKQYLFYRLSCSWPHLGLCPSVKWPVPERPHR